MSWHWRRNRCERATRTRRPPPVTRWPRRTRWCAGCGRRGGRAVAAAVSRSCACIGSPCLRHCVHGASVGGGDGVRVCVHLCRRAGGKARGEHAHDGDLARIVPHINALDADELTVVSGALALENPAGSTRGLLWAEICLWHACSCHEILRMIVPRWLGAGVYHTRRDGLAGRPHGAAQRPRHRLRLRDGRAHGGGRRAPGVPIFAALMTRRARQLLATAPQ
jgi:hypothetical protein